jgi:hypothetical protein
MASPRVSRHPILVLLAAAALAAVGGLVGLSLAQGGKAPVEREALAKSDQPRGAKGLATLLRHGTPPATPVD